MHLSSPINQNTGIYTSFTSFYYIMPPYFLSHPLPLYKKAAINCYSPAIWNYAIHKSFVTKVPDPVYNSFSSILYYFNSNLIPCKYALLTIPSKPYIHVFVKFIFKMLDPYFHQSKNYTRISLLIFRTPIQNWADITNLSLSLRTIICRLFGFVGEFLLG